MTEGTPGDGATRAVKARDAYSERQLLGTFEFGNIAETLAARIAAFNEKFSQHLAEAGIDMSMPIELRNAGNRIEVVGAHPNKARIERMFESDLDLSSAFGSVMAAQHIVEAGRVASDLRERLRAGQDPAAAHGRAMDLMNQLDAVGGAATFAGGKLTPAIAGMADRLLAAGNAERLAESARNDVADRAVDLADARHGSKQQNKTGDKG